MGHYQLRCHFRRLVHVGLLGITLQSELVSGTNKCFSLTDAKSESLFTNAAITKQREYKKDRRYSAKPFWPTTVLKCDIVLVLYIVLAVTCGLPLSQFICNI